MPPWGPGGAAPGGYPIVPGGPVPGGVVGGVTFDPMGGGGALPPYCGVPPMGAAWPWGGGPPLKPDGGGPGGD